MRKTGRGEARIQHILETITDGFVALDMQGRFTYVNRQAEQLVGRPRHDLIGQSLWEVFPELIGTRIHQEYERARTEMVPAEFEEYYPSRKAWLEIRAYPARDGMTVYYRDITRRKQAEEAQRGLVAMVSHDLRNPLFLIKGSVELLTEQLDRGGCVPPERLQGGLERIQRAAVQMNSVVDDLVDLVQLQSGRDIVLEQRPVDLVELARHAVDVHQFSTDAHALAFETDQTSLEGHWDPARLERVIGNLLTNAIKYTPAGKGVAVSVSAQDDASGRRWAVLSVKDEGLGIPPADLPHIFERFYRASNVEGRIPGSGIGLAGARHTVERHGGTIAVQSRQGQGTTFTVRLPV